MTSRISTTFLSHEEKLPEMETEQAETQEKTLVSEPLAWEDRLGPDRLQSSWSLLYLLGTWPYGMGGGGSTISNSKADIVNHGKCVAATSMLGLGNETICQTRKLGCPGPQSSGLSLWLMGYRLGSGGITEASTGWDSTASLDTLESQRSWEKHISISWGIRFSLLTGDLEFSMWVQGGTFKMRTDL